MVEKIQKLKNGQRVSRQDWEASKAAFETAYQNATPEQKAQVDGYIQSMQNYSNANPMNNRSQREYETEGYNIATKILNGDTSNIHRSMGTTTKNIFNGYSHAENKANAANVYVDYSMRNKAKSMIQPAADASSTIGSRPYAYNWANGLDSDWASDTDTLEERMTSFADAIRNNLNAARNSGQRIVGITDDEISQALALLNKESWTKDDLKTLRKAAQLAHVDAAAYKNYFGDLMPGQSQLDKNKKALKEAGYELVEGGDYGQEMNQLIQQGGYKVAKKGNQYYLINTDYSGPLSGKGKVFMNTDWRDPSKEGFGYIIGNDGAFIVGDLNPYYKDKNSPYYQQISDYLTNLGNDQRWQGNTSKFNKFTSTSDSDLLNTFYNDLDGKNIADVSRYFDGRDVIVTANGNNIAALQSKYGHLRLDDPNLTFYYKSKDGQFKKGNYQQIVNDLGDITLDSDKLAKGLQNFNSIDYNLDGLNWQNEKAISDFDVNGKGEWHNWWSKNILMKNGWNNELIGSDHSMMGSGNGVQNSVGKFARLMLYAFANKKQLANDSSREGRELMHTLDVWETEHPNDLIYIIYSAMRSNPEEFTDPRYRIAFQQLLQSRKGVYGGSKREEEVIQKEKDGGILKAAMGAGLDVYGNSIDPDRKESIAAKMRDEINAQTRIDNELKQRADENGRTVVQQRAAEKSWSTADTLRATALATDIVGLIGAISGAATAGVGSAVAVGSGFASMGLDAIADFNDDSVSTGQALKNMGINAGLAIGSMFGAKAPKIVKSTLKLLPKAMMAAGAAGIAFDPEVHNTIRRMQQGKTMNAGDWKNIITVLRTVAGIGTVGTLEHGAKKANAKFEGRVKAELKKVQSQLDPNITYVADADGKAVALDKKLAEDVSKLLKNGKKDDALALLSKGKDEGGAGLSSDVAESIIDTSNGSRGFNPFKKKFWKPGEENALRNATEEQSFGALPEDVVAEAKLNALNAAKRDFKKAANKNWFTRTMNRMDKVNQFIMPHVARQQNYELNAAIGTAYKNEAELRKDLNDKISSIGAFEEGTLNGADLKAAMDPTRSKNERVLNRAQKKSDKLAKDVDDAKKVVADLQKQIDDLNLSGQQDKLKQKRAEIKTANDKLVKLEEDLRTSQEELLRAKNAFSSSKSFKTANKKYNAIVKEYNSAKSLLDSYINSADPNIRALFKVDADGKIIPQLTTMATKDPRYAHIVSALARYSNAEKAYNKLAGPTSKYGQFRKAFNKYNDIVIQRGQVQDDINTLQSELRSAGKQFNSDVSQKRIIEPILSSEKKNKMLVEGTAEKARKKVEDIKNKNRENFAEEWKNQLGAVGTDAGTTRKAITTKDTSGADVSIPKGTKVKSYLHIRNQKLAAEVAQKQHPSGKILSAEEASKWVNSQQKSAVNGAVYDATTGELVLFQHGGQMNIKYSHLRKQI